MIVPSFDNFSDVRLSILFATGTYTPAAKFYHSDSTGNWEKIVEVPQYKYAFFTFLPVFVSFLFTFRHWYQTENTKQKKLRSLPFLILQIWPQYRVGRILHFFRTGNKKWIREKNYFETELSTIGKNNILWVFFFNVRTSMPISSSFSCLMITQQHKEKNIEFYKFYTISIFNCHK